MKPFLLYFPQCHENEIHLLYLHFIYTSWFCSESRKIGALEKLQTDMFSNYVQQPSAWRDVSRMIRPLSNFLMTKLTKMTVRPAKTQISLGIRPVWS